MPFPVMNYADVAAAGGSLKAFSAQDLIFDADFKARSALGITPWPISVSRPGNLSVIVWDASKTARGTDENTPRITSDEFTGAPLGLWIEGSSDKLAVSTNNNGATVGTVSGNSGLPTGWVNGGTGSIDVTSANSSVLGLRFYFGSGSLTTKYISFGPNSAFSVLAGEIVTVSCRMKMTASSGAASVITPGVVFRNTGGIVQSFNSSPPATIATDQAFPYEYTFTAPTDGFACCGLIFTAPATAYDFTIELSQVSVCKKGYADSWLPNGSSSAAATRPADNVTVNNPTNYFSRSAWSLLVDAQAPRGAVPTATLFQFDDGTASNRLTVWLNNFLLTATVTSGGNSVDTVIGYWIPWMSGRVAMSFSGTSAILSYNGCSEKTITGIPAGLTRWLLGNGQAGYWYGIVERLATYAAAYTSAQVVDAAKHGLYDDFARADGALGSSTTGQSYATYPGLGTATRSKMAISDGKCITPESGQATTYAYTGFDLGSTITEFGAAYQHPVDAKFSGSITMVQTPSGLDSVTQITDGPASHPNFGYNSVQLGYYANNVNTTVTDLYPANVTQGVPLYSVAKVLGTASIVRGADGRLHRYSNAGFANCQSRYALFESSWTAATQTAPIFLSVKAA